MYVRNLTFTISQVKLVVLILEFRKIAVGIGSTDSWRPADLIRKRFTARCRVAVGAGQRLMIAAGVSRWMSRWLDCRCPGLQSCQSMDVGC